MEAHRLGPPLDTRAAHRRLRGLLLEALDGLDAAGWERPTPCPGWSVKDVAAHLTGNALARLSSGRDGYRAGLVPPQPTRRAFVAALAARNEAWVSAWRGISPALVRAYLGSSGAAVLDHLEARAPGEVAAVVSWAGDGPHPNWLDAAREYSEDWAHTHDVLAALDAPPLDDPGLLEPLLGTLVRALPHAYRDLAAPEGTVVVLETTGTTATRWLLVRQAGGWALAAGSARVTGSASLTGSGPAAATVAVDAEGAWRLLLHRGDPTEIRARARVAGDPALAAPLWRAAALIA